jgi:hypothetical protein
MYLCCLLGPSGTRVWIIVDEVVLFENFPIDLPEEQDLGSFNWIVTDSAGIGSWDAKKHLEKLVFDLPLFIKEQCLDFAIKLCNSLGVNLENGIDGVPPNGVDDWLEERFGGVVGYIAEMLLELSKGNMLKSRDDPWGCISALPLLFEAVGAFSHTSRKTGYLMAIWG